MLNDPGGRTVLKRTGGSTWAQVHSGDEGTVLNGRGGSTVLKSMGGSTRAQVNSGIKSASCWTAWEGGPCRIFYDSFVTEIRAR